MAAAGGDVVTERERVMRRIRPESLCDIMGYVLRYALSELNTEPFFN